MSAARASTAKSPEAAGNRKVSTNRTMVGRLQARTRSPVNKLSPRAFRKMGNRENKVSKGGFSPAISPIKYRCRPSNTVQPRAHRAKARIRADTASSELPANREETGSAVAM